MASSTSNSLVDFHGDASVTALLEAFRGHDEKLLVIEYDGRTIQPGYHVTEVKAGTFVTLDCGGNPDSWREAILQVEDLPPETDRDFMAVGKFRSILEKVATKIELDLDARLTLEVGPPEAAMQVYDPGRVRIESERLYLELASRAAICKPRHREALAAGRSQCCGGLNEKSKCC